MHFAKLQIPFSQSKLLPPILICAASCILFIHEIVNYFYSTAKITPEKPLVLTRNKESLNTESPLFKVHLFGHYIPNDLKNQEIKRSVLDAEVVGILFDNDGSENKVILRWRDGEEKAYAIGDTLRDGATVKKILTKEIIVLHDGVLESLSLPKDRLIFEELPKLLEG